MTNIEWKDGTSYGYSNHNIEPKVWNAWIPSDSKMEALVISVHRFISNPNYWFVSCDDIKIKCKPLKSKNVELAKKEAIKIIIEKLSSLIKFHSDILTKLN
jgi:hypothetical protein